MKKFLISTLLIMHSMIFANQRVNPTLPKATYQIPNYHMIDYSNAIRVIFSFPESKPNNISKRIQNTYRAFMGKSYYLPEGPLGEGKQSKFDQNPLFRTDTFDCVTLVDTVLALIESNNIRQFKRNIIKIRYRDAHIDYIYRDQWFSQVDWNKVNQENNFVRDITYKFRDKDENPVAKVALTNINKPSWYKHLLLANYNDPSMLGSIHIIKEISLSEAQKLLKKLKNSGIHETHQEKSILPYIPLTALFDNGVPNKYLFKQIPSGSIVEIVRPDWTVPSKQPYGTKLNVSHFGIAVRNRNNELMFYEASSIYNKVVEIPLEDYLKGYVRSSTIKGINIEQIILN